MSELVQKAAGFATMAHMGQFRKYTNEPYIVHPAEVYRIVSSTPGCTSEMKAAAWLHDVVEDCEVPLEEIDREFGNAVMLLVGDLTNPSKPSDGNRAARKKIDFEHSIMMSEQSMTIKLADMVSNLPSIIEYDKGFAAIYVPEKKALLPHLIKGDIGLYNRVKQIIEEYEASK
jgi:(p)ppGpp synthase/HD superfamily hydrolase